MNLQLLKLVKIQKVHLQDCFQCQQEASHHLWEEANHGRCKFVLCALATCLHLGQDMLPRTFQDMKYKN